MNEWGIPDWTNPFDYGDTNRWSVNRWRWEFTRRREDFRDDFDAVCEESYEFWKQVHSNCEVLAPDEPGFACNTSVQQLICYGIKLLNPRISEQPSWELTFQPNPFRTGAVEGRGELFENHAELSLSDGTVGIRIDLDRPIPAQLDSWREFLYALQIKKHGKKIQRRHKPDVWLTYLRVLDGREAGATWRKIFESVLKSTREHNKNPAQEASRIWKDAKGLMYNWPS